MDDSLRDWRYLPESNIIGAPGRWSDGSGSYRDFRYPVVIAQLPDDWEQSKHGPIIAEAPAMVEALRKVLGAHGHWETEGIIEARAILERIEGQKPRYCVDGLTHADPDTAGYWGDGEFAPFVIFDIQAQRNLPGEYATRAEAEAALARIDGEGGQ